MRSLRIQIIDGFEIVCGVGRAAENPVASKQKAREKLGPDATYHELLAEAIKNPVFFDTVPNEQNVSDEEGNAIEGHLLRLHHAKRNEKLTRTGEVVPDNRRRTWFVCLDGKWTKGEIDTLGETLPANGIWAEELTAGQMGQIKDQQEKERIAAMSLEDRRLAADREIRGAKMEAVHLRLEAEITEESEALTHARSYFQSEITRISAKYRLPNPVKDK